MGTKRGRAKPSLRRASSERIRRELGRTSGRLTCSASVTSRRGVRRRPMASAMQAAQGRWSPWTRGTAVCWTSPRTHAATRSTTRTSPPTRSASTGTVVVVTFTRWAFRPLVFMPCPQARGAERPQCPFLSAHVACVEGGASGAYADGCFVHASGVPDRPGGRVNAADTSPDATPHRPHPASPARAGPRPPPGSPREASGAHGVHRICFRARTAERFLAARQSGHRHVWTR